MIDLMENEVFARNIRKGEAAVLLTLLGERFGALPGWVTKRLEEASEDQSMAWAKRILSAAKLEDVFTQE